MGKEARMKASSKKNEEARFARLAGVLIMANLSFAHSQAAYFALRGFANDIQGLEVMPKERHAQLSAVVELMQGAQRKLKKYLNEASELAKLDELENS
jgi:hypothetical protein